MSRTLAIWLVGFSLLMSLPAQELSLTITPDTAPPGTSRTITGLATGALMLPCFNSGTSVGMWSGIHNNDATRSVWPGPALPLCFFVGTNLVAGQSVSESVPGSILPTVPGTYWFRCPYNTASGQQVAWVDFRVDQAGPEPTITAPAPAWNQIWTLNLSDPSQAGGSYVAAASLSNQTGFGIGGGLFASLDQDLLFTFTYPLPLPIFPGFGLGPLDATGSATLLALIPPDPGLVTQAVHVQAVVLGTTLRPSNCVDAVIQ